MESLSVKVRLRPVRIGFLVDPNDLARVRAVMRLNTCLWGGIFNPLIPVMGRIPPTWRDRHSRLPAADLTQGYLRFFEPDVFVETRPGQFAVTGLKVGEEWHDKHRYQNWKTFLNDEEGAGEFTLGTNVTNVYEHLFRTEFQYEKRHKPRILRFVESDPSTTAFFEAAFGYFPKDKSLSYVPRFYTDALGAADVRPTLTSWRSIIEESVGFPLYYTRRNLSVSYPNFRSECVVFIFDPAKATDLIDFWNLRLFEPNVVPINVFWLEESREALIKLLKRNYRPIPRNLHGVMHRTRIQVARSLDAEEIMRKLNLHAHGADGEWYSSQSWYEPIWRSPIEERVVHPNSVEVTAATRDVELDVKTDSSALVRYPSLNPDFAVRSHGSNSAGWVNVLTTRSYGLQHMYAEVLPSTVLKPNSPFNRRGIERALASREGFVHFHSIKYDGSLTNIPKRQEAILTWLSEQGIKAEPSEPGRIADQIFEAIGGFLGTRLLAEPEVIEMLDRMARSRVVKQDGSSEEFLDRTATVQQWNQVFARVLKRMPGLNLSLERLVELGMIRLGLAVKCTHCVKENWYGLGDINETVRCERCLKAFVFPQGEPKTINLAWKYRVVGPFSTPHYAQGAYGVLLSLYFFKHSLTSFNRMTFSTNLNLEYQGKKLETDFLLWYSGNNTGRLPSDPDVIVGEAKSLAGAAFQKKDVDRLRDLAGLFPGCYLVASTLKNEFAPEEIERLRALARWGWRPLHNGTPRARLILLTGKELFFHVSLNSAWREAGGRRAQAVERYGHIFSLPELAVATQAVQLGFEADELVELRYRVKRHTLAVPSNQQPTES